MQPQPPMGLRPLADVSVSAQPIDWASVRRGGSEPIPFLRSHFGPPAIDRTQWRGWTSRCPPLVLARAKGEGDRSLREAFGMIHLRVRSAC